VKVFQEEEEDAHLKYNRALSQETLVSKPLRRTHLDVKKQTKVNTDIWVLNRAIKNKVKRKEKV